MKKIALVTAFVAFPGEKGLGRLFYLAELFTKYGYEVEIITSRFQHWEKKFRDTAEIAKIETPCKITLLEEPGYTKNVQIKRILSHRKLVKRIREYLEKNEYDLIYNMIPDNHLSAVAAGYAKKHNIPFVIDVEDLWPEAMRMVFDVPVISDILFSYYTIYAKKAYKLADAVVGASDCYRDVPLKYGVTIPNKITVYVGNELGAFDQEAAENMDKVEKKEGEFWVTYAGTLGTSYDIATLIRAADVLKKRGIGDLRVVLLGDGPMRGEFEALAKELSGNVTFVGYVPHSLMSAYLVKSDVTINSLVRKAAQSIVSKIGDYLASGKPMVNTGMDTEFRNKVEADGFGINVEPENVEALADAIEQLYRNPNRCREMGEIARKIGEAQFDRPNSYKKIIHLVDGLVDVEVNA